MGSLVPMQEEFDQGNGAGSGNLTSRRLAHVTDSPPFRYSSA